MAWWPRRAKVAELPLPIHLLPVAVLATTALIGALVRLFGR